MNTALVGRTYGPYRYEVGAEKIREFAAAISGGIPARITPDAAYAGPREYFDREGPVAPPTFCVNFAIKPFVEATLDPDLSLNLLMLVHGEQEFEHLVPIRAGDIVETTGTIAQLYEKSGKDFVVVRTESRNQRGELAVRATWTAVIRK